MLFEAMKDCIDQMPPPLPELYLHRYVNGLTAVQTGELLGCSDTHVRQGLLNRLARRLLRCLNRKGYRNAGIENLLRFLVRFGRCRRPI